ncbi:MAG TPA: hypothetical protein VIL88_00735 [Devosia sp.]|uniref:hypothetical protein n=1 Tax=Devosia sp. TaxID=1871048 RepID=UPI002F932BD5
MIPASYMFKTVYDQAWERPDTERAAPQVIRRDGLLTPMLQQIWNFVRHHPPLARHQFRSHAYR